VRLVIATALMAIARKVIIFDFEKISPHYVYATAAVVLALGVTYWLITKRTDLPGERSDAAEDQNRTDGDLDD
jgi:uncharacterized membrane protein (DUF373 family)